VRINQTPGTATAWRGDPPTIVVAPDQTVFVGWTARNNTESDDATDLFLSSSHDMGKSFDAPVKVNDDQRPAVHGMHSLAVGKDGRVFMAWLDERNVTPLPMKDMKMEPGVKSHHMESNREVFFASSGDGGRTFSTNQRVAMDACPCCKTALAVGPDMRLYLGWRQVLAGDFRHIAVATSSDGGKVFTKPVIVSDDQWAIAGCPVSGASLAVDANGAVIVCWYSAGKNGTTGLYWTMSRDKGEAFEGRHLLAAGLTRGTPVLIQTSGAFTGIWQGSESGKEIVSTARLDGSGPASEMFVVANNGELPAATVVPSGIAVAYIVKENEHQGVWLLLQRS
jgi:hypothetical protein